MKFKRVICLAAAASALGLSACASAPAQKEPQASQQPAQTVLKVAAIETAYGSGMWQQVAQAFQAQYPTIRVELTLDKNLEDVIGPALKAGDYPDVIHLATGRPAALTETLTREKGLAEVSDVLQMTVPGESQTVSQKLIPGFTQTLATAPYGDGKTYLMPMFYSPCGLFYDAAFLREKGWEVPATWEEMWALGDKAKAEGIALFTYPTAGYFDAFMFALLAEAGGPELLDRVLSYDEGVWESEETDGFFNVMEKLLSYVEPTTPANANQQSFTKNQQLILDRKALFMPNGTWVVGEMADAPRAEGFAWGFTALPAMEAGGDRYAFTFFEQAYIPAQAQHIEAAKQFLAFLYSDEAARIFAQAGAVQPITSAGSFVGAESQLFYQVYDQGAKAAMGAFAATRAVEGVSMAQALMDTVNSLVTGDKTIDNWRAEIIQAADALRAAKE